MHQDASPATIGPSAILRWKKNKLNKWLVIHHNSKSIENMNEYIKTTPMINAMLEKQEN